MFGFLKKIWRAIDNWIAVDLAKDRLNRLDIDCPHSNLEPCKECDVQAWADRW